MNIPKEGLVFKKEFTQGTFATYNQIPDIDFIQTHQTHSNIVGNAEEWLKFMEGDGLVIKNRFFRTPICIKTADCIPLLCLGEKGIAMLHAGWKGIFLNIHNHQLVQELKPREFFLGPYASADKYEVQENFREHFPDSSAFEQRENELFFNLGKEMSFRLTQAYPEVKIQESLLCTMSSDKLHSFRENQTTNRNWNLFFPSKDYK